MILTELKNRIINNSEFQEQKTGFINFLWQKV